MLCQISRFGRDVPFKRCQECRWRAMFPCTVSGSMAFKIGLERRYEVATKQKLDSLHTWSTDAIFFAHTFSTVSGTDVLQLCQVRASVQPMRREKSAVGTNERNERQTKEATLTMTTEMMMTMTLEIWTGWGLHSAREQVLWTRGKASWLIPSRCRAACLATSRARTHDFCTWSWAHTHHTY